MMQIEVEVDADEIWGSNTFYDLREMLEPEPKRGRVNNVLRSYFFNKNEKGHWVRKDHGREYYQGVPSSPRWHIKVLPLLVNLLEAQYGTKHRIKDLYIPDLILSQCQTENNPECLGE